MVSSQHCPDISHKELQSQLMEHVIIPVIPATLLDPETVFHLNPSGSFIVGGPFGDAGLTGRKVVLNNRRSTLYQAQIKLVV